MMYYTGLPGGEGRDRGGLRGWSGAKAKLHPGRRRIDKTRLDYTRLD